MAIVLIEGHKIHRHVVCISTETGVEQLLTPKAAVKRIVGVGGVLGGGGCSTVPCVRTEAL